MITANTIHPRKSASRMPEPSASTGRNHRKIIRTGVAAVRAHRFPFRMHAVPIQMSATIQMALRRGTARNKLTTIAPCGTHHASALVRGLRNQSRDVSTDWLATTFIRRSSAVRPLASNARPGLADTGPSRTNRTRSNHLPSDAASLRTRCKCRKIGTHRSP